MSVPAQDSPATLHDLRPWLGITVVALALPLILGLFETLGDPLRQTTAPSAGATWAAALAALAAGLYVGLLWRPDRSGTRRGAMLGGALSMVVVGLGVLPPLGAGAAAGLPGCAAEARPSDGAIDAWATEDGRSRARVGPVGSDGATVTGALAELLGAPIEDHGAEAVGGVPARRCSLLVSGPQALDAFPPLRDLVPDPARNEGLPIWRGELEWWLATDGRLVLARVIVGGHPGDAWGSRALRGQLFAEFRPTREDSA